MGSEFERELKRIMGGDLEVLVRMKKRCDSFQMSGYDVPERYPFMVIRGAGSFGTDLVVLRGEFSFPIEVKSSKDPKMYMSKPYLRDQLSSFTRECERSNTFPVYAFRLKKAKGDPWRVFTVRVKNLKYFSRTLNAKIPPLRMTEGGNFVMDWKEGMPLSSFLRELGTLLDIIGLRWSETSKVIYERE
ncbi:MAG: Holliday junction resolvase [Candidatus Thermoplasmatota archaeon]|nr:Holliday junction resolvase [Candidatus Thermoplasmatota archaeon]